MSSDWKLLSIGECLEKVVDNRGKTPPISEVETNFGLIEINAIVGSNKHPDYAAVRKYVTPSTYESWFRAGHPRIGDILFSTVGSIAEVAIFNGGSGCIAQNLVGLRPNKSIIDPDYLYYVLINPVTRSKLKTLDISSVQPSIKVPHLLATEISVPDVTVQKEITSVLSAIDDRITLLRETNTTLEAIAQAMFKSWFVDFDPVHAKQQGRAPEGMDDATAALFPDSFEESELGLVPKGWRVEPLTEVFDFREGPGIRNWQYTNSDQGTRFINIRCIQDGDLTIETANRITDEEANGKYAHFHLQAWDVVVSTSGTLGRSAIVRQEHLPLMLNTSVIRFQPITNKMLFCFLYEYLNSTEFLFKLESMASGSVQKNFGPMHLKQMKLVCPPIDLVSHYESVCRPLFEKLIENRASINTLATLRDTLLPRLISGQLRLPDMEVIS